MGVGNSCENAQSLNYGPISQGEVPMLPSEVCPKVLTPHSKVSSCHPSLPSVTHSVRTQNVDASYHQRFKGTEPLKRGFQQPPSSFHTAQLGHGQMLALLGHIQRNKCKTWPAQSPLRTYLHNLFASEQSRFLSPWPHTICQQKS